MQKWKNINFPPCPHNYFDQLLIRTSCLAAKRAASITGMYNLLGCKSSNSNTITCLSTGNLPVLQLLFDFLLCLSVKGAGGLQNQLNSSTCLSPHHNGLFMMLNRCNPSEQEQVLQVLLHSEHLLCNSINWCIHLDLGAWYIHVAVPWLCLQKS